MRQKLTVESQSSQATKASMPVHAAHKVQVAPQGCSSPSPRQVGRPLHGCNSLQVGEAGQSPKGIVHVVLLHSLPALHASLGQVGYPHCWFCILLFFYIVGFPHSWGSRHNPCIPILWCPCSPKELTHCSSLFPLGRRTWLAYGSGLDSMPNLAGKFGRLQLLLVHASSLGQL